VITVVGDLLTEIWRSFQLLTSPHCSNDSVIQCSKCHRLSSGPCMVAQLMYSYLCVLCFDTVGWASRRASGLPRSMYLKLFARGQQVAAMRTLATSTVATKFLARCRYAPCSVLTCLLFCRRRRKTRRRSLTLYAGCFANVKLNCSASGRQLLLSFSSD